MGKDKQINFFYKINFDKKYRILISLIITIIFIIIILLIAYIVPSDKRYKLGTTSKETIISEYSFSYYDKFELEKIRENIEYSTPNFYDYIENYSILLSNSLNKLFDSFRIQSDKEFIDALKKMDIQLSISVLNQLVLNRFLIAKYRNRIEYLVNVITSSYYIIDKINLKGNKDYIELYKVNKPIKVNVNQLLLYPLDKNFVNFIIKKNYPGIDSTNMDILSEILINILVPNAYLNMKLRNQVIKNELEKIKSSKIIQKKEIIIKKGDLIKEENLSKILAYLQYKKNDYKYKSLIYIVLSILLFLLTVYRMYSYEKKVFNIERNIYISLLFFIFTNLFYYSSGFLKDFYFIPNFLLAPFAISSISLPILLCNNRIATILLILFSLFYPFFPLFEVISFVNFLTISLITIYTSKLLKNRTDFFIVGVIIGIIELFFSILYLFYHQIKPAITDFAMILLFSLGNGLISAIVSSGIMPIFERIFNIPTHFRLLELTNPTTSPLLNKLKTEATGTYNHSMLLGDMCEVASSKIGFDSLLVRAGAYYHDIGKIENSEYFIENQYVENRHEDIKPTISVSVIKSHVKLGVEIARKYNLPEEVIDYIKEHHGTTSISYFYHQAVGLFGDDNINVGDYEYPGPKPQSKGTAILMLADSIEAAVRAYFQNNENYNAKIIQDIIDDIIEKRMNSGQFDECDITIRELHIISKEFFKFLTSYYHKRIDYPKT